MVAGLPHAAVRLLRRAPEAAADVIAVCCSTQGEGNRRRGSRLATLWATPSYGWICAARRFLRKQLQGWLNMDGASIFKVLRFVRLTGGMPSMTGKDPAAHMLLIRETQPEVYERTYKFLNVLDYLNLRLTGEFVASYDSIVTSWVTDNRDPDALHYDDSLDRPAGHRPRQVARCGALHCR